MQFRFLGTDARYVFFGTPRGWIEPGDVIEVDDNAVENYACQTELWESVSGSPASVPAPTSPNPPIEEHQ